MSGNSVVDRRVFVASCVSAAGLLLLPVTGTAIGPHPLSAMSVIIDPRIAAGGAFGAALARRGARCHVLKGDPYRFVRGLLNDGEPPATLAGLSTFADFILATGVLREARYVLVSHGLHATGAARHRCVGEWAGCESALRRSAVQWPATLAEVIAGRTSIATLTGEPAALGTADAGAVLSWMVRSKPSRSFS